MMFLLLLPSLGSIIQAIAGPFWRAGVIALDTSRDWAMGWGVSAVMMQKTRPYQRFNRHKLPTPSGSVLIPLWNDRSKIAQCVPAGQVIAMSGVGILLGWAAFRKNWIQHTALLADMRISHGLC
ncbi:hypothetical protein UF64_16570 [Thalassospira sp. HJ]|nr:hypothetical protein UF64_16570 [Thalassospira sp. HJ]